MLDFTQIVPHKHQDLVYGSTKTYVHSVGLSCCFRQWRATHSHCQFLHGYALKVKLTFEAVALDERNWVVDFGSLKEIKQALENAFDHKTLIAQDDPMLSHFEQMDKLGLIQLVVVEHIGCEAFSKLIFQHVASYILNTTVNAALIQVEVAEHEGNSAYTRVEQ